MQFFTFGLADSVTPQDMGQTDVSPNVLGGKGAGLVWMSAQGVPVPPGFIIPTTVWAEYDKKPKTTMKEIAKTLPPYLQKLEQHFGYMPLLSVRSGARVSCPGMMDTILNVGIDGETEHDWLKKLGQECFVNSLHRLVTMYGSVVMGIRREDLEKNLSTAMTVYAQTAGEFPDAKGQLLGAIEAVFKSWDNDRAKEYRKQNDIPREWGTAVTVQAMVFGNLNEQSGTGVLFTRNPDTGEAKVTGEFLPNAQGEDIVAGIRTPVSLEEMELWNKLLHDDLIAMVQKLEHLKRDVQDVEFTVQNGKLFLLQTRNAKRSATAAIRIALDMAKEGLVEKKDAVKRVSVKQFDQAQMGFIDPKFKKQEAFKGIAACSGVVCGKPVFDRQAAMDAKEPVILVRKETDPDDIGGVYAAAGVITMVGGLTSHAAVVARGASKPCIVGVGKPIEAFKDVEFITMNGATGQIWTEKVPIVGGEQNGLIREYAQMVFDSLGAVPVITTIPVEPMKQALLYLGDAVIHTQKAVALVLGCSEKVEQLYLDLEPAPDTAEAQFLDMVKEFGAAQKLVDELWKSAYAGQNYLADRLTVLGNVKHSFKTVGVGTDLRSLVLADKELLVGTVDENDPAIKRVMKWKAAEGLQLIAVGQYVEGSKSIISVQQALQIVAK